MKNLTLTILLFISACSSSTSIRDNSKIVGQVMTLGTAIDNKLPVQINITGKVVRKSDLKKQLINPLSIDLLGPLPSRKIVLSTKTDNDLNFKFYTDVQSGEYLVQVTDHKSMKIFPTEKIQLYPSHDKFEFIMNLDE